MSDWMLYVWKNFERPSDATGVSVRLEAVDPNGGFVTIGSTTSDAYGNYGLGWCPDKAGTYMIIATFDGTAGYYGATATTYLTVSEPTTIEMPEPCDLSEVNEKLDSQSMYLLIVLVLAIIAIIVALYCVLVKRK